MASYTPNYGLHQWVEKDNFLRTDFNEDLSKIDAGLKTAQDTADSKCGIVTGMYTGNATDYRSFDLGFQPKAVLVEREDGNRTSYAEGGLAVIGNGVRGYGHSADVLYITTDGFIVRYHQSTAGTNMNNSNSTYTYMAIK